MNSEVLMLAIGLAFMFEGIVPALFPNKWRSYVTKIAQESVQSIRTIGVVLFCLGAIIIYFAK